MQNNNHFAEVIESSLTGWLAQSWKWNVLPLFGSLVIINDKNRTLFGIVHQVKTGSIDPVRYPFTYQKTEEELMQEQPQIFEFLKTTFSCLTIGYYENGTLFHLLAPAPPKIHAFVSPADIDLCKKVYSSHHFLHILFSLQNHIFNLDELLLAIIHQQSELKILSPQLLRTFIQNYALLTGNDYQRIKLFFQRIESLL